MSAARGREGEGGPQETSPAPMAGRTSRPADQTTGSQRNDLSVTVPGQMHPQSTTSSIRYANLFSS